MPTRQYNVLVPNGNGGQYQLEGYYNVSQNSPRVNGKLRLQANAHEFIHNRVTMWTNVRPGRAFLSGGAESGASYPWTSSEYNEVYAKFAGRLRQGSASMGVTLASWGQARSMIVGRLSQINRIFDGVRRNREQRRRRRRYDSRALADDFLEGEFGWVPLLKDIHAVAVTVAGENSIPPQWVRSSSSFSVQQTNRLEGFPSRTITLSGKARLTIASRIDISNPNLWLLNRLGLINPTVVAWDLVPWSFVVNMFVNVNQVLSSFTDTVGLNLTNSSVTRSSRLLREEATYTKWSDQEAYYNHSNVVSKVRSRVAGPIPRPSLRLKLPNVNFELMAIASALTRQKVSRLR